MNITLGTHEEKRRAAVLRELANATDSIGRNGTPSVSELMSRLADVAGSQPSATAARMNDIFAMPGGQPHKLVTPVEQLVVDLLQIYGSDFITNHALRAWVIALIDDPGEARSLHQYTADAAGPDVAARMTRDGFSLEPENDRTAYRAKYSTPGYAARARWDDSAVHGLAVALSHYRQNGRPDIALSMANGDQMALPRAMLRYHQEMTSDFRPPHAVE